MKCHYEVLGLERTADQAAIKKAYRKLALLWHPDKNQHRVEEATEHFKLVQGAYAVLSDPQEKQWYDDHRETILRGRRHGDGDHKEGVDLHEYFQASAFSGYSDGPSGFYAAYSKAFESIFADEAEAAADKMSRPLPFGNASSDYLTEVKEFYDYWLGFTTAHSFGSKDIYDIRTAQSRWVERKMKRENKAARDAARKEYTLSVRQLAAHVHKRDKRVLRYHREQRELKARRMEENAARKVAEREKRRVEAAALRNSEAGRQAQQELEEGLSQLEQHTDDLYGADSGGGSKEDVHDEAMYCSACRKRFKSEKQWENHLQSKKHISTVALLREKMEEEDIAAESQFNDEFYEGSDFEMSNEEFLNVEDDWSDCDDSGKEDPSKYVDDNSKPACDHENITTEENPESGEDTTLYPRESRKMAKKRRAREAATAAFEEKEPADSMAHNSVDGSSDIDSQHTSDDSDGGLHRFMSKFKMGHGKDSGESDIEDNTDGIHAGSNTDDNNLVKISNRHIVDEEVDPFMSAGVQNQKPKVRAKKTKKKKKGGISVAGFDLYAAVDAVVDAAVDIGTKESDSDSEQLRHVNKPSGFAALAAESESEAESEGTSVQAPPTVKAPKPPRAGWIPCQVCGARFETRNKLFNHIKKTGHAVPIAVSEKLGGSKKKKNFKVKK